MKFSYSYNNYSLDKYARCRWSTNPDEPLLFVKCDWTLLNILDVEKEALILKSPVDFESGKCSRILNYFSSLFLSIGTL